MLADDLDALEYSLQFESEEIHAGCMTLLVFFFDLSLEFTDLL